MAERYRRRNVPLVIFFSCFLILFFGPEVMAQTGVPQFNLTITGAENERDRWSITLQLLLLLTVLSLAPSILLMVTSFTRIVVVLSILKHALGTQQLPPSQVIVGLALFLTFFIMTPVWQQAYHEAFVPYFEEEISGEEALKNAAVPLREFMLKHTREKDIALFVGIAGQERPEQPQDVPFSSLIPSFMISELKTAFQIGFMIFLPFLVIDMVVASILLSMGMLMLPPIMISLPFKLLLFVLVDGWHLIVGSLVQSFQ